jgi:myo-inositol-1(or 4)-monophosphatase
MQQASNVAFDRTLVLQEVEKYAQKVGEILLSYYEGGLSRLYKSDGSFATEADVAAEQYLIKALTSLVPGAGFYAEESGVVAGNDYVWVIDPLDGTSNFAHGLPYFCTSIALTYKQEPIIGVIYQPVLQQLFSAQQGQGAFCNGKRLAVSKENELEKAMVTMCSSMDKNEPVCKITYALSVYQGSIRSFGASALDIAYCAAGKMEACFYEGTCWWDIAAGSLLLKEAGGKVSTFQGGAINPENRTFVGGNEPIFRQLSSIIQKTVGV